MAQHVQPSLLQLVDKEDELTGGARVGHHQQHLRPPELHVLLPHVQHQEILPHLTHSGAEEQSCECVTLVLMYLWGRFSL